MDSKFSFIIVLLSFLTMFIKAQKTSYYKLTRKVKDGVNYSNVSGGQFITFTDNACYESDIKGYSVNNGVMDYKYSVDGIKTYVGNSYWGSHTVFLFNSDLSGLNVQAPDGFTYVYRIANPPANATTCSLIRTNSNISSGNVSNYPLYQPIFISGSGHNGGSTCKTNESTTSRPQKTQPIKHDCPLCHGKKTIIREYGSVPTFGKDTQRYCNVCGRNYWLSSGHAHITCTQCHGKGYF